MCIENKCETLIFIRSEGLNLGSMLITYLIAEAYRGMIAFFNLKYLCYCFVEYQDDPNLSIDSGI